MARLLLLSVLLSHFAVAQAAPLRTTVCDIAAHPARFSGRLATVPARIIAGFEVFAIEDQSGKCQRMWLQYSGGSPTAMVSMGNRVPRPHTTTIELILDSEFEKFQSLLDAEMYPRKRSTVCMSCKRWLVSATVTGRVHVAPKGTGFGHLNAYPLQFELQSVADVVGTDLSGNYDSTLFSATPVRFSTGYFKGVVRSPSGDPVQGIEVTATRVDEVPLYLNYAQNPA